MSGPVIVRSYGALEEAAVAFSWLRACGVEAELHQYNLCTNLWALAFAVKVNLQVPADQLEAARAALAISDNGELIEPGVAPVRRRWSTRVRAGILLLLFVGPTELLACALIGLHALVALPRPAREERS